MCLQVSNKGICNLSVTNPSYYSFFEGLGMT